MCRKPMVKLPPCVGVKAVNCPFSQFSENL